MNRIINGNSLDVLKTLPKNSVDAVVTDPPYGLSFMGKKWDYDVPSKELWQEVFRVLKPGGHLLAFAGTRTQHRMAVNIEDAGFEIRDMIAWVYGSGFPKSLNIGKAIDRQAGVLKPENKGFTVAGYSHNDKLLTTAPSKGYVQPELKTDEAKQWEGWGTALKPALEPITVARKPIKGSVASNVLQWGTGGINIDGCRVGTEPVYTQEEWNTKERSRTTGNTYGVHKPSVTDVPTGRFPANLIHDGSDEVVGLFPETKSVASVRDNGTGNKSTLFSGLNKLETVMGHNDSGSAARFFYVAKASKSERNKGLEGFEEVIHNDGRDESLDSGNMPHNRSNNPKANFHPTVKPVKLMQYLVRLVTPIGGTVLDPFNGSGTTGIACKLEGFDYIGIELDPEYVKISEARIEAWEPETKEKQLELV